MVTVRFRVRKVQQQQQQQQQKKYIAINNKCNIKRFQIDRRKLSHPL